MTDAVMGLRCIASNGDQTAPEADGSCAGGNLGVGTTMAASETMATDPSYYQAEIGYKFGDTGVAVSWYNSEDMVTNGSEGTALGIGVRHTLAKVGAELYAAIQNYEVTPKPGMMSMDESVAVIGTRVKF